MATRRFSCAFKSLSQAWVPSEVAGIKCYTSLADYEKNDGHLILKEMEQCYCEVMDFL